MKTYVNSKLIWPSLENITLYLTMFFSFSRLKWLYLLKISEISGKYIKGNYLTTNDVNHYIKDIKDKLAE